MGKEVDTIVVLAFLIVLILAVVVVLLLGVVAVVHNGNRINIHIYSNNNGLIRNRSSGCDSFRVTKKVVMFAVFIIIVVVLMLF